MDKDDVYTIIVRKFPLGKDEYGNEMYIYRPLEFQMGFISEGIFYNDNAREYESLVDISFVDKDLDEGYYMALTKEDLEDSYGVEDTRDIYRLYQDIIDNKLVVCLEEGEGLYTTSLIDKDSILNDINLGAALLYCFYSDGQVVVPIDDIRGIVETGDIEKIKDYIDQLDEFQRNIEELEYEEEEEKEEYLTEEDKKEIAEELLKEQKRKEAEAAFQELEETTITKEEIRDLYKELMGKVIGQEEAIETACYVIYKNSRLKDGETKTNCIFVGPTGSGKSMIADSIGEVLKNKPLVHIDSNSLSTTGYVGGNVEDCLSQLMVKADGNKTVAEHGIVVFDEVDKKGTKDNGDVGGKGVINQLLRFVEGQQYTVEYVQGGKKRSTIFDTTNLTVFACGAFPEVYDDLISKNVKKNTIGFGKSIKSKEELEEEKKESFNTIEISQEDLALKGRMGPEFTARFIIAPLHKLSKDNLKEIMTKSTASPLSRQIQLLDEDNIVFCSDEKFVDTIANNAYKEGSGGRGVKNTLDKVFKKVIKKAVFTLDDSLIDEDTGKVFLYGTADDDGQLQVVTTTGKNLLDDQPVKTKSKIKELKK